MNKIRRIYNIQSPDGIPISYDWFNSPEDAWSFYRDLKKRFERQGYYSSNRGRIPLDCLDESFELIDQEVQKS